MLLNHKLGLRPWAQAAKLIRQDHAAFHAANISSPTPMGNEKGTVSPAAGKPGKGKGKKSGKKSH